MNSKKTIKDFKLSPIEFALLEFTNALYESSTFPKITKEEIRDLLSSGQIISKKWLLQEYEAILKHHKEETLKVVIVGGWLGFLASALITLDKRIAIDTYDLDPRATYIANKVLIDSSPNALTCDMYKISYDKYDCVINTSTEHIKDIPSWSDLIPRGKWVIAQGNSQKIIKDHISCVESSEELAQKLKLSEIIFSGELVFPFYTRYMVIGKK